MTLPQTVLGVVWAEFAVATMFVGVRTVSAYVSKSYRWDFWLAWLALLIGLAANILCTISVGYGTGHHTHELDPTMVKHAVKYQWILFQTYVVAYMIAKLSVIAFLLEFERNIAGSRKYLLWAVGVINVAVNMGTSSLQWQQCKPVQKTWDDDVPGVCNGRTRNTHGGYVQGSFGAAIDIFLSIYPIFVFWRLNLDLTIKLGLCALFGLGTITAACAVLKTVGIALLDASDTTYQLATLDIYSLTELWAVLIIGSIPPTKQLFSRVVKRGLSRSRSSNGLGNGTRNGYSVQTDPVRSGPSYNFNSAVTTKNPITSESEEDILAENGIRMTRTVNVATTGRE